MTCDCLKDALISIHPDSDEIAQLCMQLMLSDSPLNSIILIDWRRDSGSTIPDCLMSSTKCFMVLFEHIHVYSSEEVEIIRL
jgi:hypothetical protein